MKKKKINKTTIYNKSYLDWKYHTKQYSNTYETTKQLCSFLKSKVKLQNKNILDLGCGAGANIFYLKNKFNVGKCTGVDLNPILLDQAKKHFKKKFKDVNFYLDDINKLKKIKKKLNSKIDIVTTIQVLSVLEDYSSLIKAAIKYKPKIIVASSLFWDGNLDIKIKVNLLNKKVRRKEILKTNIYNIYSLQKYLDFMKLNGYKKNFVKKLIIKKKLKVKSKKSMGTYTSTLNGNKVQITGPIIQDWYFVISKK